jgi:hypothetical protein
LFVFSDMKVNYENDEEWHLWNQEAKRRIMESDRNQKNQITIEIQKGRSAGGCYTSQSYNEGSTPISAMTSITEVVEGLGVLTSATNEARVGDSLDMITHDSAGDQASSHASIQASTEQTTLAMASDTKRGSGEGMEENVDMMESLQGEGEHDARSSVGGGRDRLNEKVRHWMGGKSELLPCILPIIVMTGSRDGDSEKYKGKRVNIQDDPAQNE